MAIKYDGEIEDNLLYVLLKINPDTREVTLRSATAYVEDASDWQTAIEAGDMPHKYAATIDLTPLAYQPSPPTSEPPSVAPATPSEPTPVATMAQETSVVSNTDVPTPELVDTGTVPSVNS